MSGSVILFLVVLITTGVVPFVFVLATAIAVVQFGKPKFKTWKRNRPRERESSYDRFVPRDRERERLDEDDG